MREGGRVSGVVKEAAAPPRGGKVQLRFRFYSNGCLKSLLYSARLLTKVLEADLLAVRYAYETLSMA